MSSPTRTAIIFSASSDIGAAMSERWLTRGWKLAGTYRTPSNSSTALVAKGMSMVRCDFAKSAEVSVACRELKETCPHWDVLVIGAGLLDPIGPFADVKFEEWRRSVEVNFTAQMQVIHELLPSRNTASHLEPCVLLFAGGGVNSAPVNYSAYTISKIALIKMCELLSAEIPDCRFVILGPGWVRTKIHASTLKEGSGAGQHREIVAERLARGDCTPMERVLDCCDWLVDSPRDVVSGRNFSVVFDQWDDAELAKHLKDDSNMYKLRRAGNDRLLGHTT